MELKSKTVLVELNNISKIFKKGAWAVKKINLKIYQNEIIVFLGANGSGKSVLASIIANDLAQTSGFIDYYFLQDSVSNSIGVQLRDQNWPSGFFVKDIIELYRNIFEMQDEVWVQTLIEVFEINTFLDKQLAKLSVVNLQMFNLFLAFFHKPELVVVDEISSSIGYNFRNRIFEFFNKYIQNYNGTLIVVSPDHDFIDHYASRVIFLNDGHVIDDKSVVEIASKYNTAVNYIKKMSTEIASKAIKPHPDPFFKPIIKEYNTKLNHFKKQVEKDFNKFEFVKDSIFQIMTENIVFYFEEIEIKITELANDSLEKDNIIGLRKLLKTNIRKSRLELNKLKAFSQKNSQFLKLKQVIKEAKIFIDYLNQKLKAVFRSNQVIFGGNIKTLRSLNSEQKELQFLKQKYIKQELRLIKQERKKYKKTKKIMIKNNFRKESGYEKKS
ncbi:ABC transporter ATP-binding protein [Spiroplasma sabaudiense Ar-1343]|uniref:ABC transporter ATP-binding protein n=1 Tax=Spiroplasma sabaudiense Ar-1343 TaxID=1276257 RepID=W6A9Z8_9MOLU|nr:ATP-binding cassette domain-containing protein [Spiroplasma sabaudiense]AHI54003.1 ABC transporter ATP-binding protein [Spiroplasma sabaudiense Ar-1343]